MVPLVADSSPLIALKQISQLSLLEKLFGRVFIPPAVGREVRPSLPELPTFLEVRGIDKPIRPDVLKAALGPGESEVITLALEQGNKRVLIDERRARRVALDLGLEVVGTLGVLLAAKQEGYLDAVRPRLDALVRYRFHLAEDLYDYVLEKARERFALTQPRRLHRWHGRSQSATSKVVGALASFYVDPSLVRAAEREGLLISGLGGGLLKLLNTPGFKPREFRLASRSSYRRPPGCRLRRGHG